MAEEYTTPIEEEIERARHSGLLNPVLFDLEKALVDLGWESVSEELAFVPEGLFTAILEYCTKVSQEIDDLEKDAQLQRQLRDDVAKKIEEEEDRLASAKASVAQRTEKYDAMVAEARSRLKLIKEARMTRARDTQQEIRERERVDMKIRRETLERDRLRKMCKA